MIHFILFDMKIKSIYPHVESFVNNIFKGFE